MNYKSVHFFCGDFWIATTEESILFDIGYKDVVIMKNADAFSTFEEKILAIRSFGDVYVYIINKNCSNVEDAVTLINILSKRGIYEVARFMLDEYLFNVDFNCKILCCGRK